MANQAAGREDRFREGGARDARSGGARRAASPRRTDHRGEWKSERSSMQQPRGEHRGIKDILELTTVKMQH